MSAMEALRSGNLDTEYNDIGRDYEARQGISMRSSCPIYLALKTHVLAIKAAIEKGVEKDFYVSDLFDIFTAIQERSEPKEKIWGDARSNPEFPTPYAFLIYTITTDLADLSRKAVESAVCQGTSQCVAVPGEVARDLARNWSFCVWSIARWRSPVTSKFRNRIIERYLVFVLTLSWAPSEIWLSASSADSQGLAAWRDLFSDELKARFARSSFFEGKALEETVNSLDQGKGYVRSGYSWLKEQLEGEPIE
jgi:hypothetical protein